MCTAVETAGFRALSRGVVLPVRSRAGIDEDSDQAVQGDVLATAVSELTG
ncbi:MAG: hypothetical protein LWW77_02430 [Propionibacteriales bacterium]|nr:hypothetical protein [Propionibacteriales bacterium]